MKGSVFKRCGCAPTYGAKGQRMACKLKHGSWSYIADTGHDPKTNKRRQIKRGGFATKTDAERALAELVDHSAKGIAAHDERQTVGAFLESWLAEKERNGLRPTTARSYRQHIDDYFVPAFGHLRLRELRPMHVEAMLAETAKPRLRRKSIGPASVRRIHATLRSALGTAKRRRLISYNPAVDVDLPATNKQKVRPWEPAELGRFLDHVAHDSMGPLFETIAATGLRRGEAAGLRWDDINLERGRIIVRQQLVHLHGNQPPCAYCGKQHKGAAFGRPKTSSGEDRSVDLDGIVVGVLIAHRLRQDLERAEWGSAYSDHGLVFARQDGTPIAPNTITQRFNEIVAELGLRRIRLHDLRHGRASLLLAAGVDIALVSKLLGHSSIGLTVDTYSHLLEGVGKEAAERATALVPRNRPADPRDQSVTNPAPERSGSPRQSDGGPGNTGLNGAASENRTPDLLITSETLCRLS
jgi:integrase